MASRPTRSIAMRGISKTGASMVRRKPSSRIVVQRSSENEKRQLRVLPPALADREDLAQRATYGCYSKHKRHPHAYGLASYAGSAEDRVYCDAHAGFSPSDMERVGRLLRRGIMAGLWSENTTQKHPTILWTVDDNGWIYELRITNPTIGQYHGYPLLPNDAFARKVLAQFVNCASDITPAGLEEDPTILSALKSAQGKYR